MRRPTTSDYIDICVVRRQFVGAGEGVAHRAAEVMNLSASAVSRLPGSAATGATAALGREPALVQLAADALLRRLWLVRNRWRWVVALEALLLGGVTAVVVALVVLAAAAALERTAGVALVLAVSALPPGVATAIAMAVHRWRGQRDLPQWVQVRAERHTGRGSAWASAHPHLTIDGEALRSGVEMALHVSGSADTDSGNYGSAVLLMRTLATADVQATGLDADVAAIGRRCRGYGLSLVAAAGLAGWVAFAQPGTWRNWWTEPGRPELPPREVGTLVGDSRLQIATPEYAAAVLGARQEDRAETTVLRGSHVKAHAASLPGLQVDAVEFQPAWAGQSRTERQAVMQVPVQGIAWQRTVLEPLRYRYVGRDEDGKPVREAGWRQLSLQQDQPPTAELTQPKDEVVVRPGQDLALQGRVDDDIGLRQIEMVVQRPATGVERRPLALQPGAQHSAVHEVVRVDTLQLRAGEIAEIFIEASDTNPFDDARKGTSAKLRVRMFSADRHHNHTLDLLGKMADSWALRLADRLEGDPAASKTELAAALKRRAAFAAEEQRALEELRALRQQLAEDVQARPRTLGDIVAIERQLTDTLSDEARAVSRWESAEQGYGSLRDLYQLQRHHALVIHSHEEAVAALSELAADELEAGLARDSQALTQTERDLVTTLEKMADTDAKPLQAEAERLMDQLEQHIERLASSGQQHQRLVPYEHVNAQALHNGRWGRDLQDQRRALAEVRALVKAGKTREALERMRALGAALRQTSAELQQGASQELSAEEQALQRLVQDLRRGIDRGLNGQGRLRDELRGAAEESDQARQTLLRSVHERIVPRVQQLLADARENLRSQRLRSAVLRNHAAITQGRQAVDTASEALRGGQLDRALQAISEAQDNVASGQRAVGQAEDDGLAVADGRRLDDAATRLMQAAAALREALPEAAELLRPGTAHRLETLMPRQQRLRHALERLRRQLAEHGDAQPALQQQVGERLDHALQTQKEVEGSLGQGDARRAFDQTAEVLDALERAAEMLQQGRGEQQRGGGQISPQPADSERVDLRSGNQTDGNDRFREQLLRAMQLPEPGGWHDRLQRYYKAIAR
jgi:hypothetical protein